MIDVEVNITVDESNAPDAPWLDEDELRMMLDQTRAQLTRHVQAKLSKLQLEKPLKVVVSGEYRLETEQMDIAYHIDTDDKQLLMQAVMALNR